MKENLKWDILELMESQSLLKKTENNFLLLISSVVIFLSIIISVFLNYISRINETSNLISQVQPEGEVLGYTGSRNYESPKIYITSGNNYSSGGVIPIASTDEPAVYVTSYEYNGEAEVSLYKADLTGILEYLIHDKEAKQLNKKPDISKYQFVTSLKQNITSGYDQESKVTLPLEETGIWLVVVNHAGKEDYAYVIRSNFGVVAKEGDNKFIFWGQSFITKRSLTFGSIKLINLLGEVKEIASSSFNSEGICQIDLSANADVAIAENEGNLSLIPLNLHYLNYYNWQSFLPKTKATTYFLFTDRPIYRPGDKLYFKSVLRDDDDARYTIPSGNVIVKVFQDSNNPVIEKNFPTSKFGTVDGEIVLPAEAKVGYYQIGITRSDVSYSDNQYPYFENNSVSFQIENYRKPEYSIDVAVDRKELITKEKLAFNLSGSYFSGEALADQKVSYRVASIDYYNYEYFADNNLFNTGNIYGYYGQEEVTSGEVIFNQHGEAIVDIDAIPAKIDGKDKVFTISATFDNGSGNPSFDQKNVLVYAGEFGIYRKDSGYGGVVNKEISIPLTLVPHRTANISQIPLSVKIHRENWVSKNDPSQKYSTYVKEEEDFPAINLKTNSKGEATLSYLPKKVGSYTLTVQGTDSQQNIVVKDFYTWVTDKDYSYHASDFGNELFVKAEKAKYEQNEKAALTIYSSLSDRDVLLSLERGRVDRYQVVRLKGNSASVTIPLTKTDIPNINATVSSFSNFAYDAGSVNLLVSAEGKKVIVSIVPDRKVYGPGQTVNLNIQTTDLSGNPVSAETAVWAVDKAIFELAASSLGNIFNRFWSERGNSTNYAHSLQGIIAGGAEGGGCFSGDTLILMGSGKNKPISQVKVGDEILTRSNNKDVKLIRAKVKSLHQAEVEGYLIINGSFRITSNHILNVNGVWKEAGSIQTGDQLSDKDGKPIVVSSIEWNLGKFTVYNLEIEKYHTFFAGGVWVHNDKGESREIFKDTAYWNPSVVTDSSGRAKVSFRLPDNLTTWVVAGVSATADTKVGQSTSEIAVTKSIIVRPLLPNILRIGDKTTLSCLVQNNTDIDQEFDVSLSFDSGEVSKPKYSSVTIKAGKSMQFYWPVDAKKENDKTKLTFTAQSLSNKDASDSVISEIPVLVYGFYEDRAEFGEEAKEFSIAFSSDSDADKSKITLLLSSSLLGSLDSAAKYLLTYPYGCSEQVTSSLISALVAKTNPELFSSSLENHNSDEIVNAAIKKLIRLQLVSGGWNWWNYGNTDPFKTAYVVEGLVKAKHLGYEVNEQILSNAKYTLENTNYKEQDQKVAQLYALSLLGSSFVDLPDLNNLTPDLLSLIIMTNIRRGNNNPETNGLNRLLSLQKEQGVGIYWEAGSKNNFGSQETSTALAIRALIAGSADRSTISKAVRFLVRARKYDYWTSTFATSQVIQALNEFSKQENPGEADYSYTVTLDDKVISQGNVSDLNKKSKGISINIKDVKKSGSIIKISKNGNGEIYETLLINEFRTDKNIRPSANGITIERDFENQKGRDVPINVGDTVIARIKINGLKTEENYLVIDDQLPAGLIPINERLTNEQFVQNQGEDNGSTTDYYVNREIDGRNGIILSVYKITPGEVSYIYKARAVSEGEFGSLPIKTSLMYAPEVWARSTGGKVTISKARESVKEEVTVGKNNFLRLLNYKKEIITALAIAVIATTGVILAVYKKKQKLPQNPPPVIH